MRISDWSSDVCSSDLQNDLTSVRYLDYSPEWSRRAARYAHETLRYIQSGAGGHRFRLMDGDEYERIFITKACKRATNSSGTTWEQIGRASCREGVGKYGKYRVVAGPLKKKKKK